jgi:hypothetical protein
MFPLAPLMDIFFKKVQILHEIPGLLPSSIRERIMKTLNSFATTAFCHFCLPLPIGSFLFALWMIYDRSGEPLLKVISGAPLMYGIALIFSVAIFGLPGLFYAVFQGVISTFYPFYPFLTSLAFAAVFGSVFYPRALSLLGSRIAEGPIPVVAIATLSCILSTIVIGILSRNAGRRKSTGKAV